MAKDPEELEEAVDELVDEIMEDLEEIKELVDHPGPLLPLTAIALEVMAGKWGVGQDRRIRLDNAGYNVRDVQREVTRLINKK